MLVDTLIDQYLNTTDNDLKYMTLRQEYTLEEADRDLRLLVYKVLLPVLHDEPDAEIVDLVSFQVYPQAVSKCVAEDKVANSNIESQWFDDIVVQPLLEKSSTRGNLMIQTLRNVLKVLTQETNISTVGIPKPRENSIKLLVLQMIEYNVGNEVGKNMVIYWETLNLLISLYYTERVKMSGEVLEDIFKLCPQGELDEMVKSVLINTVKASTLQGIQKVMDSKITDSVLEVISRVWYQFGPIGPELFTNRLLPALTSDNKQQDLLLRNLQIVYNLRAFYEIDRVQDSSKVLSPTIITKLATTLAGLLNTKKDDSHIFQKQIEKQTDRPEDMKTEIDEDPEQQAYLEQLQSDDEELEFEDEDEEQQEEQQQLDHEEQQDLEAKDVFDKIQQYISLIMRTLQTPSNEPLNLTKGEIVDLDAVQINTLTDETDIANIIYTITSVLTSKPTPNDPTSSLLTKLLLSIEVLNQLMMTTAKLDYSNLCSLLLRHLKQNKAFVHTIKVGNMTQTIDEGIMLRTMVYSTILQILTKAKINYTVSCQLLKEILSRGIKDSDHTVNELSIKIAENILQEIYSTIKGIDWQWYNETLYPKVLDCIAKWQKKRQINTPSSSTTSMMDRSTALTAANDESIMFSFLVMFSDRYPAIL